MSEKEYKSKCKQMFIKNTILINENEKLKKIIKEFSENYDLCSSCPYNVSEYALPSEYDNAQCNCERTADEDKCLDVVLDYQYGVKL